MQTEKLRITLRKVGRAFVQCLKRFKEEPLTEAQEWARFDSALAREGYLEVEEDARVRDANVRMFEVFRPYRKFYNNSERLVLSDLEASKRN